MLSRRRFLAWMGAAALAPAWPAQAETDARRASLVNGFMQTYGVPGAAVAMASQGRMVYSAGFGLADRTSGERVTPQSRFRIASVSKPFTAVTIMRLLEQGRIHMADKVFGDGGLLGNDYGGPTYKPWVTDICIEHLLTHTAGGWPNDGTDPMFRNPRMTQKELITWAIDALPLTNAPGTAYAYSNFGYCILGRVVEKLTNQPYPIAVQERVLGPCGVVTMQIGGDRLENRLPGEVVYYGQNDDRPYAHEIARMDSHGGWIATAEDLVAFLLRVDGFSTVPDILRADTERLMTTPSTANPSYAKGWAVNRFHNYWHDGALPGTTTIMVRTSGGWCWAALTNTRRKDSNMAKDLDALMWQLSRV